MHMLITTTTGFQNLILLRSRITRMILVVLLNNLGMKDLQDLISVLTIAKATMMVKTSSMMSALMIAEVTTETLMKNALATTEVVIMLVASWDITVLITRRLRPCMVIMTRSTTKKSIIRIRRVIITKESITKARIITIELRCLRNLISQMLILQL